MLCTNIILPQPPPPPTLHLQNRSVTGWSWHLHRSQLERSGNPWIITENMAATSSLSSELLATIQVPNLRPMPVYLSESDSLTVAEFLQTHYAAHYKINVSNVHWGGEINASHLFDIYCNFHLHKDSVKTQIDMISFVTSNYRRYSWDCDLLLRMNKLTLNDWVSKMSYWGNCGDALAIYAMSGTEFILA